MSTLSHKLVAACMVTAISMVMYGCGGGGGGDTTMMPEPMPDPMCSDTGQVGTYPDCMDPAPPGPTYDGPKTAMALDAYGKLTTSKNVPEIAEETTSSPSIPAITRAVDGTLSFEDGTQDTVDAPNTLTVSEVPARDVGVDGWMGSRVMKTVAADANPQAGIIYTNLAAPTPTKLVETSSISVDPDNPATITEPSDAAFYPAMGELMGTYRGVAGTFTCATSFCTITRDMDGAITAVSPNWGFESTDPVDSLAMQATDYLFFGAWLETTPDDDANVFKAFSGGDDPYNGTPARLEGSATYSGPAAGLYATKELELKDGVNSVVEGSVQAGEFTAMANLSINFGGDDIPASMHNRITGTINQFMDGDTELDFVINLFGDPTDLDNVWAEANRGTTPETESTAAWSMAFFGPDTDADNNAVMPSGIAGQFDAHFPTGHVAGGFGATKQ